MGTGSQGEGADDAADLLWARPAADPVGLGPLPALPDGAPDTTPDGAPDSAADTEPAQPHPGPPRLTEDAVLRPREDRPVGGVRGWLYRVTGGAVNLGPSRSEQAWDALVEACCTPCPEGRRVAVISRKGGVGKTTTTLMLGHTLAAVRPDRVLAVDGNPDAGTLGHRVARQTDATVIDALADVGTIQGYPQARGLTSQAPSRLEVLASPEDPHASRALRGEDYQAVLAEMERHYNVLLCDTGTGITDDANLGILDAVDQIVLVTGTGLDTARAASMTLDWLQSNGRGHLVRDAVVVVNAVADTDRVDVDQVVRHFADRTRSVHRIPHDRHLEAGAVTDADLLAPATQEAWLRAAAAVVEGFGLPSARAGR